MQEITETLTEFAKGIDRPFESDEVIAERFREVAGKIAQVGTSRLTGELLRRALNVSATICDMADFFENKPVE